VFGIALAKRCDDADAPLYVWETRRHLRHEHEPDFAPGSGRGFFRGLGDTSFLIIPWWEEFVGHDQKPC
jgi:hypothetical protein